MIPRTTIKYLIAGATGLVIVMSISGIAQLLGAPIPTAFLIIIFLAATLLMSFADLSASIDLSKLTDDRAQGLAQKYNGQARVTDRIAGRNCYNVSFVYKGRPVEFIDNYRLYKNYAEQNELLIRTKTNLPEDYVLNIQASTGSTIIGRTADRMDGAFLEMSGCGNIASNPVLADYKGLNIYTNDGSRSAAFLAQEEVRQICLKYFRNRWYSYVSFPVKVQNGYLAVVFIDTVGHNMELTPQLMPQFGSFLDDLAVLAEKIGN